MEEDYLLWQVGKVLHSERKGGLGFRDLEIFNKPVLAKQGWRIMNNSNLLISKVLSALYHHDGDFLRTQNSSKTSYLWRSLVRGKEILEKWYRWRIR